MKKLVIYMFFVGFIGLTSCQKPSTDTNKKYPDKKTAYRYPQVGKCVCPYDRLKTGQLCEAESEYGKNLEKESDRPLCYLSDLE
jgi:hypothetical protein